MMKKSLRLLFGLLIAVATVTTLSCRVAVRRGFVSVGSADNELLSGSAATAALNSTLLTFAEVDIGEAKERKEVEQLLEGNYGNQLRSRSISSWRRENHPEARPRGSVIGSIPIRTPKYFWNWHEFRRVLRDWYRRKRFEPEIMNELVGLVKGPMDRHYGFLNSDSRYGSCAVVGNSGILLQSEYGKLIDSHEVVIRLNNARIKGFERSVGSKTSISFVNSNILHLCARREGCFCHPYGDNVPLVMYICQPVHFMDYTICNSTHKSPLLITDSRFDLLCARIVKYYSLKQFVEKSGKSPIEWAPAHDGSMFHYSSGMQAVMLALGICDKVSIFGFGKSVTAKHHYHTNQKAELHLHDYEAEYAFYQNLVERSQVIPFLDDKFKIPQVIIYH